jgi:hypothetical protein
MKIWKPIVLLASFAVFAACAGETGGPADSAATDAAAAADAAGTAGSTSTAAVDAPKPSQPAPPAPAPKPIVVPAGTELSVILADALDSGKNKAGDEFTANLAAPLTVAGKTVIDRGAKVQGRIVDAESSGRVSGKATLTLALTGVTHRGKMVPLVTKTYFEEAKSTKGRDAAVIAGAAGVGAAIGAIAGGGKGAATGGAIGGAAGTGTVLATKGEEVKLAPETKLSFTLDKDLSVTP